jgi:hypothetical protein
MDFKTSEEKASPKPRRLQSQPASLQVEPSISGDMRGLTKLQHRLLVFEVR